MKIGTSDILQLGEPSLRQPSVPVSDVHSAEFQAQAATLQVSLADFRAHVGFGRAIAAPQIGVNLRFIALNLGKGPITMVNPVVTSRSAETFTMFDDCMSFPALFVKLQRHRSMTVEFIDGHGRPQTWKDLDQETSELLQHEIDHLDGILAVDRAATIDDIVSREAFERNRELMTRDLGYVIPPLKREAIVP